MPETLTMDEILIALAETFGECDDVSEFLEEDDAEAA